MGSFLAALFIGASLLGAAYVTIINPGMAPDAGESYAWTSNCVDEHPELRHDEQAEKDLAESLGYGTVLAMLFREREAAVAYFFDSDHDARRAEEEIKMFIRQGAQESGLSHADIDTLLAQRIKREHSALFLYGGSARAPTAPAASAFGECIYVIGRSRFGDFDILGRRTVARPFRASER